MGVNGRNQMVRVLVGGETSNTVCMQALPPSAGTTPRIEFMIPEFGSVGTYVTLFGENFGLFGSVRFINGTGTAFGDTDFPAQCSDGFWNSTSVTVKVPNEFTTPDHQTLALVAYEVSVLRSDGQS